MPKDPQQSVHRTQAVAAPSAAFFSKVNDATLRFLSTDVETGLTFARMAARTRSRKKARPSDTEKITRYLAHARTAHDAVASRIGTVRGETEELRKLNLKFSELRKLLRPDEKF